MKDAQEKLSDQLDKHSRASAMRDEAAARVMGHICDSLDSIQTTRGINDGTRTVS